MPAVEEEERALIATTVYDWVENEYGQMCIEIQSSDEEDEGEDWIEVKNKKRKPSSSPRSIEEGKKPAAKKNKSNMFAFLEDTDSDDSDDEDSETED